MDDSTICAIATPAGKGALSVIRISGSDSISICDKIFTSGNKSKKLVNQKGNTIHFGTICTGNDAIDEVLVSLFKAPVSYTGEDSVEISCHGSLYIQQRIIKELIVNGARLAKPGEFTLRAFLNGKMDLSQAEAVSDLIASQSSASHRLAFNQMRGGFSNELNELRNKLLNFVSLIELELDFSEEDVEFANRSELSSLLDTVYVVINRLIQSFDLGNVIKNGIPVAIVGNPNVGKSTLLNGLVNEEKSIVTDIAGTTRDAIEDTVNIEGIVFRFIDTAGIRQTTDAIETIGIKKTFEKIEKAEIVLLVIDIQDNTKSIFAQIENIKKKTHNKSLIVILNKIDKLANIELNKKIKKLNISEPCLPIVAKDKRDIHHLSQFLVKHYQICDKQNSSDIIISNSRHYESLLEVKNAIIRVTSGLQSNLPSDLLTQDIRHSLHYIGEITGEITTDEILGNIFSKFCIGK